jgi:hypothetical protein
VKKTVGRERACLQAWPEVCIATLIKRTQKKHVVEVIRRMTQGTLEQAQRLLAQSLGGTEKHLMPQNTICSLFCQNSKGADVLYLSQKEKQVSYQKQP